MGSDDEDRLNARAARSSKPSDIVSAPVGRLPAAVQVSSIGRWVAPHPALPDSKRVAHWPPQEDFLSLSPPTRALMVHSPIGQTCKRNSSAPALLLDEFIS